MKKFIEEFKAFALKGNVLDMAVGVIIGGAFTGIVTALTDNFINPFIQLVLNIPDMIVHKYFMYDWAAIRIFIGSFGAAVINFLILALILFIMVKAINKMLTIGKKKEEAAPTTKKCEFCKSEINIEATRCPCCTAKLVGYSNKNE